MIVHEMRISVMLMARARDAAAMETGTGMFGGRDSRGRGGALRFIKRKCKNGRSLGAGASRTTSINYVSK